MRKTRGMIFATAAALALSGCAWGKTSTFPPGQNTIYVSGDCNFYTALLESYDPADTGYSDQELRAMAASEAAEYNGEYGTAGNEEPVAIQECSVSDGTARVVYRYGTAEDLCRFTEMSQDTANHPKRLGVTADFSDVADEDLQGTWTDAGKNEAVSSEKVLKKSGHPMVIVSGTVTVQTEGKILYYKGAVTLKDEYTARVTGGTAYIVFR